MSNMIKYNKNTGNICDKCNGFMQFDEDDDLIKWNKQNKNNKMEQEEEEEEEDFDLLINSYKLVLI